MSTLRGNRRPYTRSMAGWWKRDRYYKHYLAMECTSIWIALYALILMIGLYALERGESAYSLWLDVLSTPLSVAFHVIMVLALAYHTWTWFKVMPKTLPSVRVAGTVVTQRRITWVGTALAVLTNLLVIFICIGLIG